jgi:hypothetical protein
MVLGKHILLSVLLFTVVTGANASFEEWIEKAINGEKFSDEEFANAIKELLEFNDTQLSVLKATLEKSELDGKKLIEEDKNAGTLLESVNLLLEKDPEIMTLLSPESTETTAITSYLNVERLKSLALLIYKSKLGLFVSGAVYWQAHSLFPLLYLVDTAGLAYLAHKYGWDKPILEKLKRYSSIRKFLPVEE